MPDSNCPSELRTGLPEMDALHARLYETILSTSELPANQLASGFQALAHRVGQAFAMEELWMEGATTADSKIHREQHALVLSGLHHTHSKIMSGDLAAGRDVLERLLPQWLYFHSDTMDSPLALAVQRERIESVGPARIQSAVTPAIHYGWRHADLA
jgi:hemerythrin